MSLQNFMPSLWSARALASFDKKLVYGGTVNRTYEGEARYGNKVKINFVSDVTIGDYTGSIPAPQQLDSTQVELAIDQRKYFNFVIDDVDKAQANANIMDVAMAKAAQGLAASVDKYISGLHSFAATGNTIGDDTTPIAPTTANAYDYLVDLGVKLSQKDVPTDSRCVVVTPAYYGLLLKDARFIQNSALSSDVVHNGFVGMVNGMQIFQSTNVANTAGTKYKIMAFHVDAIALVAQVDEVKAYSPEALFGEAVKGLIVFGAKVVRPEALAVMTSTI